jgi:hypothetical protein
MFLNILIKVLHKLTNLYASIIEYFLFQKQNINIRLWNRFFNTIYDYENDPSYEEILKKYFGIKTKPNVKEHRTIQSL